MEVGNHRIGYCKVIGREDKLVSPSFVCLQVTVCAYGTLNGTHHSGTYSANLSVQVFGTIYNADSFFVHNHLFRICLVLRKVFHINITEVTQTGM